MSTAAVRVKICGITNWPDARAAIDLGAEWLGFNFYPPSPRSLAPAEAWQIRRRMPPGVKAVGVFVNWSPEAVLALAEALDLAAVQLHGDESPRQVAACARGREVVKAFRVGPAFRVSSLARFPAASAFLLDGSRPGLFGGTGRAADWSVARRASRYGRIFLAGGLTPGNVSDAIHAARPFAVDVASGVESRPGKKDRGKLRDFFREVERANRALAAEPRRSRAA